MMDITLNDIPQEEVWRYLGYDDKIDDATNTLIKECSYEMLATIRPKALWKNLPISIKKDYILLKGLDIHLYGQGLVKHLMGCSSVILLAATIGIYGDILIRRCQVEDMVRAMVMDSCATAAIEAVCDQMESFIIHALPNKYFTSRFSPGYEDFLLTSQKDLLTLLDAPTKIGLSTTDTNILLPSKSVTAIIGVSDTPIHQERCSCYDCMIKHTCQFRIKGKHCGL